jgi:hypothetical protein
MSSRRAPSSVLLGALAALAAASIFGASAADAQVANGGARPFASGMLSSISGSTLQVQEATGNATVVVTPSTSYQQTKSASASDIAADACARVSGTGSTATGIEATTVALSKPATKGGCSPTAQTGGRFGGAFRNGTRPNLPSGQRPNFPSGRPDFQPGSPGTDANGGSRPPNFAVAMGAVKSISGDRITMKAYTLSRPTSGSNSNAKPKVKTQNVTVTLTDSTAVTQTVDATAKDLTVGACVNANGNVDSVGTITARRVAISQPRDGACTGFGFGFGGGGGGRFGRGDDQQTA